MSENYTLYDSIFITSFKFQNYRNWEQTSIVRGEQWDEEGEQERGKY